jgi:catechol 2,3-dioxygenase-like lactoylglutathione lyase family enzyme
MPRTGFIDHTGIGVPDLAAAKLYTTSSCRQALEPGSRSRHGTGLQHLSFMVSSRTTVRQAHEWAVARHAEIVHEPREFPEYGEHNATYFLDPHRFMLEVVCHSAEQT